MRCQGLITCIFLTHSASSDTAASHPACLQMLGMFWQTPSPLIPERISKCEATAHRSMLKEYSFEPNLSVGVDITTHMEKIEAEITSRADFLLTEIDALAATVQQAAVKEKAIRLTRKAELDEGGDLIKELNRHFSLLNQAWMCLNGLHAFLAPFAGKRKEEEGWKSFAPPKGAVLRVQQGTKWLFWWVAAFHLLPLVMRWHWASMYHTKESFKADTHSLTGMLSPPHLDEGYYQRLDPTDATRLMTYLDFEVWGVLLMLLFFLGSLCKITWDIVFSNLHLPAISYLCSDPFIVLPMILQLLRLVIVLHVNKDEEALNAAYTIAEQLILNVLLQSYIFLDIAREKAPVARMLLSISFAFALLSEYLKRSQGSTFDLSRERVAPTGTFLDWYWGTIVETDNHHVQFGAGSAKDALFSIDETTILLMLKGIPKTFLRPHHCSFLALAMQLPDTMAQGNMEFEQKLKKGQRRFEALEQAILRLPILRLPAFCRWLKPSVSTTLPSRQARINGEEIHVLVTQV